MQPTIILRGHGVRGISVVPRHPLPRPHRQFRGMPEQLCQIVERIDPVQFALSKAYAGALPVWPFLSDRDTESESFQSFYAFQHAAAYRSLGVS